MSAQQAPPPPQPATRPLLRGADRKIAGVCSGLAEYFALDTWLVRLIFLVLLFSGGVGLLLYIALWIVMPDPYRHGSVPPAPPQTWSAHDEARRHRSAVALGAVLVIAGALILLGNLGYMTWVNWSYAWPVILILLGALLIGRRVG